MKRQGLPSASHNTWTLVEKPPRERPSASASAVLFLACGLLMRSNRGRVQHQPLGIHLLQRNEDPFPNSRLRPSIEALINTIPLAIPFGQVAPWRPTPGDPQHAIHKLPIVLPAHTAITGFPCRQGCYPLPFSVAQFISSHPALRFVPERSIFFAFFLTHVTQ